MREVRDNFEHWSSMSKIVRSLKKVDSILVRNTEKLAFSAFKENAIEHAKDEQQFINCIEFFSERRPENLLQF